MAILTDKARIMLVFVTLVSDWFGKLYIGSDSLIGTCEITWQLWSVSNCEVKTWSASQNLVLGSGLITWLSPASLKMIENSENRMEMNWAVAHTHKLSHDFVIVSTCHIEYFYNGFFFCYLFCFLAFHLNDHLLSLKMNYSLNLIYLQSNFWFWSFLELTFFKTFLLSCPFCDGMGCSIFFFQYIKVPLLHVVIYYL